MEEALADSKKYKNVKKRRDALHRKARIMKTALKLFAEEGYHAITVEDIIHHVDMTRGAFYKHFKSKENIIQLILDTYKHYLGDILAELVETCQGESGNRWKDIILNKTRELLAMPQIIFFLKVIFGELNQIKASFSNDIASYENQMTDMLAQALQTGQERGDFSEKFDSQIAALCIIGGLKQIFMSRR